MHTVGFYEAIQKNEIMTIVGKWMQLEVIMLNRINQTWKSKYIFSLIVDIMLICGLHTCTDRFIYVSVCHKTRKGKRGEGQLLREVGKEVRNRD